MNNQTEVSIICTCYNHEKYLRTCLDGLVMQKTSFPFEIIVHDDASTDSSAEIIREYEQKYPDLIRPIYETENQYQKNKEIIRQICSAKASGRFFAFCEGDDYWTDPMKLQKQYDFMNAHPDYSLCACSTKWIDQLTGKVKPQGSTDQDMDVPLEDIILEKNGRIFIFVSYFIKREFYDNFPTWRFPIGDYPLSVCAALHGKVRMLASPMCVYRYHAAGSWTQNMNGDAQRKRISERMIEGLEDLNRDTEGKYEEVISKRILRHRYTEALMDHNFQAIRQDSKLYEMYRGRKMFYRFSDRLHCASPKLFHMMNKLLKRED